MKESIFIFSFLLLPNALLFKKKTPKNTFGRQEENEIEETLPWLQITCLGTCQPSDPELDTLLEAKCVNLCEQEDENENFTWTFTPKPSQPVVYENGTTIVRIKPNSYKPDMTVYITLSKSGAEQYLNITYRKTPHLNITCIENCSMNVSCPIRLSATCIKYCELQPKDSVFSWNILPFSEKIQFLEEDKRILLIPESTYQGGQALVATVRRGMGSYTVRFTASGGCLITPSAGYSDTSFFLFCNYIPGTEVRVHQIIDKEKTLVYSGPLSSEPINLEEGDPTDVIISIPLTNTLIGQQVYVRQRDNLPSIVEKILGEEPESLESLLRMENYEMVVSQASMVIQTLFHTTNPMFKKHYLRHVVAYVYTIAQNITPILSLAFVSHVTDSNITDTMTIALLAGILRKSVHKTQQSKNLYGTKELQHYGHFLFSVMSNILKLAENATVDPIQGRDGDYLSYGEWEPARVAQIRELRKTADHLMDIIDIMGRITDSDRERHLMGLYSSEISATTIDLPWQRSIQINVTENSTHIDISERLAKWLTLKGGRKWYCNIAVLKRNPFWWQEVAADINSDVIKIDLFTGRRNLSELPEGLDIYLQRKTWRPGVIEGNLTIGSDPWRVHKLFVNKNTQLTVTYLILDQEYYALVSNYFPTLDEVRNSGRLITRGGISNSWILQHHGRFVYVAVARKLGASLKFTIEISEVGCVYWEGKQWLTSGCTVASDSTANITHCICHHLSVFGATFFVPPSSVNTYLDVPLIIKLKRSALVIGFLCGYFVVWGVLMVWAAGRDAQLNRRLVLRPLDTVPGDNYPYLVGVATGLWQGAGTSARVAMQLIGTQSNSRVHLLQGLGMLQSGAEDWFVVQTPRSLGIIRGVRFFHDSSGFFPHWFCESVEVRDFVKRRKYRFRAQKWLSLIRGDGQVDRIFSTTEETVLKSGGTLFPSQVCSDMRDAHVWLSVFTRPVDSTFTSKERVAACSSLMLLALTCSAIFYTAGYSGELDPAGSMQFSTRELAVIAQTLCIVFPYGVIVTTLFRKSAPSDIA